MSHMTIGQLKVKHEEDLLQSLEACGMVVHRDVTKFTYYGRFAGDTVPPASYQPDAWGRCLHKATLKDAHGGDYEVGVIKGADGLYDIAYDTWGPGQRLVAALSVRDEKGTLMQNGRVKQEYAMLVARRRARAKLAPKGFVAREVERLANGRLRLRLVKR